LSSSNLAVVIFRNNLRVADNPALYYATQNHQKVLGLYSNEIHSGWMSNRN